MAFISHLICVYRLEGIDLSEEAVILVDNARIHKSFVCLEFLRLLKLKVVFIPEYSPMCAPVERFFGRVKFLIREFSGNARVNWSQESSTQVLIHLLSSIHKHHIVSLFTETFKTF